MLLAYQTLDNYHLGRSTGTDCSEYYVFMKLKNYLFVLQTVSTSDFSNVFILTFFLNGEERVLKHGLFSCRA